MSNLDSAGTSHLSLGGHSGAAQTGGTGHLELGGMSGEGTLMMAGVATLTLGASIAASGVVASGTDAQAQAVQTIIAAGVKAGAEVTMLAEGIDKLLRELFTALENPANAEFVLYAWSMVLAIAAVIYVRQNKS